MNPSNVSVLKVSQPGIFGAQAIWQANFVPAGADPPGRPLYFCCGAGFFDNITKRADPFVLAVLYPALLSGTSIRVEGAPVSRSLVANLQEFQQVFLGWFPRLKRVAIHADLAEDKAKENASICTFSGGLDSCHSVYKLRSANGPETGSELEAVLMVHGFDIPLDDQAGYSRAVERAKRVLQGMSIEFVSLETNIRTVLWNAHWSWAHGLCLAAALTVFSGKFGKGVIPSTLPYAAYCPWGTNPLTDRMLGSGSFEILHHGAGTDRFDKLIEILDWRAALDNLRVCWEGADAGRNCGQCPKCVLLGMMLNVLECHPACLDSYPDGPQVAAALKHIPPGPLERLLAPKILAHPKRSDTGADEFIEWVSATPLLG